MKPLLIFYLILGGVGYVLGKQEGAIIAVGAPEPWIALVKGALADTITYVGLLGGAGILAIPALPQAMKDVIAEKLSPKPTEPPVDVTH